MSQKSQPVLITMSVLAGAQVLSAGSALAEVIPDNVAQLLALVVASVQVGMAFYVRGKVVPEEDVLTFVDNQGHITDGKADIPVEETYHGDVSGP